MSQDDDYIDFVESFIANKKPAGNQPQPRFEDSTASPSKSHPIDPSRRSNQIKLVVIALLVIVALVLCIITIHATSAFVFGYQP